MKNKFLLKLLLGIAVAFGVLTIYNNITEPKISEKHNPSYTTLIRMINNGAILKVRIQGQSIGVLAKTGEEFSVKAPEQDPQLINDLLTHNVDVRY